MNDVFFMRPSGQLARLRRAPFETEDLLQGLLEKHPALLGLVTPDDDLLLVSREQGVPATSEGGSQWYLDHLYIDRQGVPILVEVKRASDTRARREVVAQMLDYAANGIAYWPTSELLDAFARTCASREEDPEAVLGGFLGPDHDIEAFWRGVEANLRSGRIRMVFVADEIPRELRRIIEFLNEQMRPAEVIAVQIEQYEGEGGARTFLPQVIGATERAVANKTVTSPGERLSTDQWLERLGQEQGADALNGARRAIKWFEAQECKVEPTASQDAIHVGAMASDGRQAWPFFIRRNAGLEISLQNLAKLDAFASDTARQTLVDRLQATADLSFKFSGNLTGWPSFPTSELLDNEAWKRFCDVATWVLQSLRG